MLRRRFGPNGSGQLSISGCYPNKVADHLLDIVELGIGDQGF